MGSLEVIYDGMPMLAKMLPEVADQLVAKAAFDIQARAASVLTKGYGLDTGFMKSSIYARTHDSLTWANGSGPIDPPPGAESFPEVEAPPKTQAIVAVGASYGMYPEFGTVKMRATPYLTPAVEEVGPVFLASLTKLDAYLAALGAGILEP